MPSVVYGATLIGVEAVKVGVEVDLLRRLPQVVMVGLPAPSVRESADRVRSAIVSSGFEFPRQRVVVALAPADLRKEGTAFDLPIAVGILVEAGKISADRLGRYLFVGELSLTGELRAVRGALAFAWLAREAGFVGVVVPAACAPEAALVDGIEVRAATTLAEVFAFLQGEEELPTARPQAPRSPAFPADLADIRGQEGAREALEVAAAGGHNLLLEGPPGCGKGMPAGGSSSCRSSRESMALSTRLSAPGWWWGSCPACGGRAVYRRLRGALVGACADGAGCWWAMTEVGGPGTLLDGPSATVAALSLPPPAGTLTTITAPEPS